ncbi:protein of unknown function DUF1112 [Methanocaldococcus vulcanius M7]|uniref:Bax inhibitor-1/YccA family protein n=1 Tax=Methanocaldococcus vulcanius (strain ATCC 700851 / DSM 12094 / M7) TaxID=579137 RepID=C9RF45_METVM|nr:Bax inhibitor-1/YccA family protein [Methanocaldococcus vulcanius]ACX72197.1 protein of unknown function DUF1112 [Methanocaldococcus vulcanius M7]
MVNKSAILILITLASSIISFYYIHSPLLIILTSTVGVIIMLILFVWVYFDFNHPQVVKYLSPIHAVVEGLCIGAISYMFESSYDGIVSQALFVTFGIFLIMLFIYKYKIIKVTNKFKAVIIFTTLGIVLYYIISIALIVFAGIYLPTFKSGLIGIGFSLFVGTIASLNLLLDFNMIEKMVKNQFPKDFEWYCAFALLTTLIWIYIEIIILFKKLRDNLDNIGY